MTCETPRLHRPRRVVRRRRATGSVRFRRPRSASATAPRPCAAAVSRRVAADPAAPALWDVEVEQPVWAPAPGQAAVFYAAGEVLGGGRIATADA